MPRHRILQASALLAVLTTTVPGCGGYGEVSPAAYEHAKAHYSITNRKADDALAEMPDRIEEAAAAGELTGQEADWLHEIVDDASGGDWRSANAACRAVMEDQVKAASR